MARKKKGAAPAEYSAVQRGGIVDVYQGSTRIAVAQLEGESRLTRLQFLEPDGAGNDREKESRAEDAQTRNAIRKALRDSGWILTGQNSTDE